MRCEGCDGKFGANGEPEAEVESEDVADTTLTADVLVNVPCANCGGEYKSGYVSIEAEIDDPDDHNPDCPGGDDRTFEITSTDAQVSDDYRPKTRTLKNGQERPVPLRFQRHYYDVEVTFSVRCTACETEFEVKADDSIGAGELEAA